MSTDTRDTSRKERGLVPRSGWRHVDRSFASEKGRKGSAFPEKESKTTLKGNVNINPAKTRENFGSMKLARETEKKNRRVDSRATKRWKRQDSAGGTTKLRVYMRWEVSDGETCENRGERERKRQRNEMEERAEAQGETEKERCNIWERRERMLL